MLQVVVPRLAISALLFWSVFAAASAAQEITIQPPRDGVHSNAAANVMDIVRGLEQHGLKKQARQLETLLENGKLLWFPMGKDAPAAITRPTADGKNLLLLRADYLGGTNENGELKRYQSGSAEHVPYTATIAVIHELVHHEQPLSHRQDGTFNQDYLKHYIRKVTPDIIYENTPTVFFVRSELEAYQKSLKAFTEQFILPTVERYLETKDGLHSADQARLLQDIQSMLLALSGTVRTTPKHCSDRVSRWQAILIAANTLHDIAASLRTDAESRAECTKTREKYEKIAQTKRQELAQVTKLTAELTGKLNQQKSALQAAIREVTALHEEISQSSNRLTVARQIGDLENFIRLQRPQIEKLETELDNARQQKQFLERSIAQNEVSQRQITSQIDQCRKNYVASLISEGKIKPSQLPPDMSIDNDGQLKALRPAQDFDQKARTLVKELRDLFSFDPDKLKDSDDPRTPEVSENTDADQPDRAYVIYLEQKSDTPIYMVDKRAAIETDSGACKSDL